MIGYMGLCKIILESEHLGDFYGYLLTMAEMAELSRLIILESHQLVLYQVKKYEQISSVVCDIDLVTNDIPLHATDHF